MEEEHVSLLADTHFWVLVATIGFVVLAYVKGRKPLLAFLDARTDRIRAELEEAEKLNKEAHALLEDCQKKHTEAVETAKKIVENAAQTAERLQKDALGKLEDNLKRKEAGLIDRIKRAEATAVQDLRDQAADIAAKTAEVLLQDILPKNGNKLIDGAIKDISGKLN